MQLADVLQKNKFPLLASEIILSSGITELYPPQAEAIEQGVLDGHNLLMSVPTAAGKTLIAELSMLKSILSNNGHCLYIAPLKALASEKYNDFKEKYAQLGINVGLAIGDAASPIKQLDNYHILIATAEKMDSLLRSRAQSYVSSLTVIILDEIHFINDGLRGPTMEILAARINQLNENIQIVALSATVSNANEMAGWLKAKLVLSDWRPIPLKEGVYHNEKITFDEHGTRIIGEDAKEDLSKLSLDTLRGDGQVLIFVNSRRSTQAVGRNISKNIIKILTNEEKSQLAIISKKITGEGTGSTEICRKLADCILHGVAFHHAGLKPRQRELIENNFKKNLIKVICCTPTLAAGVNLPARRVVIRDCKRFESGIGAAYIPVSEYKQCAGRAGRPQYDKFGDAVLIAKSISEQETLFEKYIHAKPEPVISKLSDESALRIHVLASISGGYVHGITGMLEFIEHTFLYYQNKNICLFDLINNIFDFLQKEKLIEKIGTRVFATPLGSLTSRLYIDPVSTITIRDGLNTINQEEILSPAGILHMLVCCPDSQRLNVGKKDQLTLGNFEASIHNELIFTPENFSAIDDLYQYLSSIKTTWLLMQWINEETEDFLCEQFKIGPGDIYRHAENTQWLLYAAGRIAELLRKGTLTFYLNGLRNRIRYGIREELLEMARLKGIGRIRARSLFNRGFKNFTDLRHASVEQLSQTPQISKNLAKDIQNQLVKEGGRS